MKTMLTITYDNGRRCEMRIVPESFCFEKQDGISGVRYQSWYTGAVVFLKGDHIVHAFEQEV